MATMTLEEFKELTKDSWNTVDMDRYVYHSRFSKKEREEDNKDVILVSWSTGGYKGGSCWGGKAEPYTSDEKEPDFPIEDILEKVAPQITFLKYRTLSKEIDNDIVTLEYTLDDYYGNSTDYKVKFILIDSLYNIFVDQGII